MKKVTLKFAHDGSATFEEFYATKMDSFEEGEFNTLFTEMKGMVDGGDIWFRHYHNEGDENHLVYILDSDAALANFETAKDILEGQAGFIATDVEEITFEEFAAYATAHDESYIAHPRKEALLNS